MQSKLQTNSFLIAVGCPPEAGHTLGAPAFHDRCLQLWLNKLHSCYAELSLKDRGFELYLGEFGGYQRTIREPDLSHQGALLTYSASSGQLAIKGDRLGTVLLFYKQCVSGGWLISNRLENLAVDGAEPDWSSVQQYLHTGFTVGSSTLLRGVCQTLPNQEILIAAEDRPSITLRQLRVNEVAGQTTDVDALQFISERLLEVLAARNQAVLMMSAGWDSRTLLAPGSTYLSGAYTHGDLSSREIDIARRLSGGVRLDHLFADSTSIPLSVEMIDEMLDELGYAIFPIWYAASHIVKQWKSAPIMSGVLGELLGGHYGLISFGSRWQKMVSSILIVKDDIVPLHRIERAIGEYCTPPETHWFVSGYGQEVLNSERLGTKSRVSEEIHSYYNQVGAWQSALEDFNMAHRARQYILKQAQASINSIGYYAPFADPCLVDLTRRLDFGSRVHNKTNRLLLKQLNPGLLKSSMAATLVSAKHPIIFQELSRGLRILLEKASVAMRKEKPRLGWFNYDHLYETTLLHGLTDSLKHEFWDRDKMHLTLEKFKVAGVDAGFVLDMLCKLKYVDHVLMLSARP